eukprot:6179929-Pleurochrysis_carterae.AAC.1
MEGMSAADGSCAVWSGPRPKDLSLERLAGSLIMSDTCNAARATKRRLAAVIEAAARNGVGRERWEAMSTEEQTVSTRVFTTDCAQHIRNIILSAMSAAPPRISRKISRSRLLPSKALSE